MARPTITKERVLIDEHQALQCDICSFVYATTEGADHRGMGPEFPEGSGMMFRTRKHLAPDGGPQHSETREFCPTCMSAVWDEVEARRKKHKGGP